MIVTVSREYGAAGLAVADGIAQALGYELLTDDLPKAVAARLGTTTDDVAARATAGKTFSERMLGSLEAGTPEAVVADDARTRVDFDESVRREIERAIRERAARGDIVILGRNAGAVLGKRPDLVRVFLHGEREWRLARVIASFGQSREAALADLERIDAARRRVTKERYKFAMGDARYYDLCLDVSRFEIARTVALVVDATRAAQARS